MGFVSLKYDACFKAVMENETVRKYFISDTLGIPVEEIKSVKLANPFLRKHFLKAKQGILDVLVELNHDSKVNIELQIKIVKDWNNRSVFYLTKMFSGEAVSGEKYERLKRCISISILDFNLDERPEYHKIYRLRDEQGYEYSDMLELHIIELRKKINGTGRVDEWICLFNAESKEELDVIQARTKNPGILAAIKEVREMGLGKDARALYEAYMKQKRDRIAREEYVRDEAYAVGRTEAEDCMQTLIARMTEAGEADKLSMLSDKGFYAQMLQKYGL